MIVSSLTDETCCGLADQPSAGSPADCRSHCPAGTKPKRLIAAKAGRVIGAAVRVRGKGETVGQIQTAQ